MDKNNDFENAVEVTSVTTEQPKSKNRIRKRHESKLRKTLRIIKNIICWGVLAILVLTVIVFMGSKVNGKHLRFSDIPCFEFQRAVCSPSL